jgi:hypothetical protein
MANNSYFITSFSFGTKYKEVQQHWEKRIREKCKNATPIIYRNLQQKELLEPLEAWWDVIRTKNILSLLMKERKPIVQCDLDVIIEKDIQPLIDLDYDFIISQEHYGENAYPAECSNKLGFGVCSGFYIVKPSGFGFLASLLELMVSRKYGVYSDQVTLMNYIVQSAYKLRNETIEIDGVKYINTIIELDGYKLCVLDFELVRRDPFERNNQLANHINVDSIGGIRQLIRYYYEDYKDLPLSCGCTLIKNPKCYYHKLKL